MIIDRTEIKTSYIVSRAPVDGYTVFKNRQEALETLYYRVIEKPGKSGTTRVIDTVRFIGQKMIIQEDEDGNQNPIEYCFRDGIEDQHLVIYDEYPWEYINPYGP